MNKWIGWMEVGGGVALLAKSSVHARTGVPVSHFPLQPAPVPGIYAIPHCDR